MAGAIIALIGLALIGVAIALYIFVGRWRAEQAESRRIRATFSRYVSPMIVSELLDRKDSRLFSGREMRATILVCRIWNFSHFIEPLTPEQTLRYLNEFYAMAGTSIERQASSACRSKTLNKKTTPCEPRSISCAWSH
jgi:hypothetical protein